MTDKKKISIIGSGNWACIFAKIIGINAQKFDCFNDEVLMYVYEELIDGKKLSDFINDIHENVKYLPGQKLPANVVAVPDLDGVAKDADILVFIVPHKYVRTFCAAFLGKLKSSTVALSLVKGLEKTNGGVTDFVSRIISVHLKIPTSVLMGNNFAGEVGHEKFCEVTIGCKDKKLSATFPDLLQTEYFSVNVVDDVDAVEVCGTLKSIVGCAAGFMETLEPGQNAKAMIFRVGLLEMIKFVDIFYPNSKLSTFFESCGIADLISTCFAGHDLRLSAAFICTGKSIRELEEEMLGKQKLMGAQVAQEIYNMLRQKGVEDGFPLFNAVHKVFTGELNPEYFLESIRNSNEHINVRLNRIVW